MGHLQGVEARLLRDDPLLDHRLHGVVSILRRGHRLVVAALVQVDQIADRPPGPDALVKLGRLQRRRGIFAYYCAPYLRQQENVFRSLDPAVRRGLGRRMRALRFSSS